VIVTFELEDVHGAFAMVHAKTLFPKPKPVMVVFGNNEFVITPVPETRVHVPAPVEGKFPFMVADGEVTQTV
jgi:hypothetical protein